MKIYQYAEAIQYDGTNGAAIAAAVGGDFEVTASGPGVPLEFVSCGNVSDGSWLVPVPVGGWLRYGDGCAQEVLTAEAFAAGWLVAPE